MRKETDILIVGAGIMGATLAAILKQLEPDWDIQIVERMDGCAKESSAGLNNAGTGHSGFCELNYDVHNAVKICEWFEKSKQFWSYLVKHGSIEKDFIHRVPHISFVSGKENVEFLKNRCEEFKEFVLFEDMEFSDDPKVISEWIPLVMKDRDPSVPVGATRMKRGVDVNFGLLTKNLICHLQRTGVSVEYNQEVYGLYKSDDVWNVFVKDIKTGYRVKIEAKKVFVMAGGAALTLLEESGIKTANGYGGFPVSGEWLVCDNPKVVNQHMAKVYGKPEIGAPPMSVPHLDTRFIDGKKMLLFGPYAGFSTKFLKHGSWLDFFRSIRPGNLRIIIESGLRNMGLVKYLFKEVLKTKKSRFKTLLEYYPSANINDWKKLTAGQRVQVIKKEHHISVIKFGTEIVIGEDSSIAGLLGASPGASVSVKVVLDILEKCFNHKYYHDESWKSKLKTMIPSSDGPLFVRPKEFREIEENTSNILKI